MQMQRSRSTSGRIFWIRRILMINLSSVRYLPMAVERRFVLEIYLDAKQVVIDSGFEGELEWQSRVNIETLSEEGFLAEASWVVLSAGMREVVVRRVFPRISAAFEDFRSAQRIKDTSEICYERALSIFHNERKIKAIIAISEYVAQYGLSSIKDGIKKSGLAFLYRFPFMGPATAAHLAKNIGFPVGKPDRHLVRIARCLGYAEVNDLCVEIARSCGDDIGVVDLVWWRFATLKSNYLDFIGSYTRSEMSVPI
jgi:hypothetical protein